jgi:glycine cleavage system regulatory protein
LRLELTGADHPGIVSEVAGVLAEHSINIEEFSTESIIAPMSGEALFTARADLEVPPGVDQTELQHALERLAQDLVVQIQLLPEP